MAEVEGDPDRRGAARLATASSSTTARRPGAARAASAPAASSSRIHEGRKHQVKRMLEAVGHPVTRLHRSRYAGLTLEGLEPGESRELDRGRGELTFGYGEPAAPS